MSLSNEALTMPVLSIERRPSEPAPSNPGGEITPPLRRSVSLSGLDEATKGGRLDPDLRMVVSQMLLKGDRSPNSPDASSPTFVYHHPQGINHRVSLSESAQIERAFL
jgi:hypothetical protein